MTPHVRIQLLGEFRLWVDGQPLDTLYQPRPQALLAYLLLHRHAPQPRQQIAFHFWPDSSEQQAFTNLRKLFFQVRQALPWADAFLTADTLRLGWRMDAPFTLDVADVEQALHQLEQSDTPDVTTVEHVVALYTGELLPTCYDDWLLPMRRSLHERVVNALTQALTGLEARHEYEVGLRTAAHLVRLDPLHEAAYRHLMRFHALSGNRAGALRVYHKCVTMLEQELGVPPAAETQALYQQLLKAEPQATPVPAPAPVQRHEHVLLVGRKQEWQLLQQAWQAMSSRGPHMVMLWGEAGVGKTRLVEELLRWARLRPGSVVYARCYAAEGMMSYAPITQWLRSELYHNAVRGLADVWRTELARLLPELLIEQPTLPPPLPMYEGWQRQRFYEALARAVLAAPAPRLIVLDDLQWCDVETLQWLQYLLRFDGRAPLLVVGTTRSEDVDRQHPLHEIMLQLRREQQLTSLELGPLHPDETASLARQLVGEAADDWAGELYKESEGNPLFVVEIVRAGWLGQERGLASANSLPSTVQAIIAARLAQLSPLALQVAQVAATIGRTFTVDIVARVEELAEVNLVQSLDELWQRRIVREQANGYDFTHDKIREVVYAELPPARRRWLHRRIGTALSEYYAGRLDEVVGELAVHAERAGQIEDAIGYLHRAAQVAQVVGAYPDVVARLRKAIGLLPLARTGMPRQELALLVSLGAVLIALRGYGDPEVEAVYRRAHDLCTQLGDDPYLMPTLTGLALFYMARGNLQQAHLIARQALLLAERAQDASLLLEGHLLIGAISLYLGQFQVSCTHLEQALALYDPAYHSAHADVYGQEPGVTAQAFFAVCLWYMGYADRSVRVMRDALALAQRISHRYTTGLTYFFATWLHRMRREPAVVHTVAINAEELASRHGFQSWHMLVMMHRCWAAVYLNLTTGEEPVPIGTMLEQMQAAFTAYQRTGADLTRPYCQGLLAEVQAVAHDFTNGLALVDEALALMAVTHDHTCLADIQRLRGELLLAQANAGQAACAAEAEEVFLQAICTAQSQEAKMLELRAAVSLGRLWQRQGKRAQAYKLLSEVYGWFTEGFDTPDLQAAKALLEHLSPYLQV